MNSETHRGGVSFQPELDACPSAAAAPPLSADLDVDARYKETSEGGLAVSVVLC
jgi:hypothetical protein